MGVSRNGRNAEHRVYFGALGQDLSACSTAPRLHDVALPAHIADNGPHID